MPAHVTAPRTAAGPVIAYVWAVYPRDSASPITATGITADEDRARGLACGVLTADRSAGFAVLQPVSVSAANIATDRDLVSEWPPAGRALIGRRNTAGGVTWRPMSPGPWD